MRRSPDANELVDADDRATGAKQGSLRDLPPLPGGHPVRRWRRAEIYDEMYGEAVPKGVGDEGR